MRIVLNPESGATGGGVGDPPSVDKTQTPPGSAETVSKADLKRALDDMHANKRRADEAEARLKAIETDSLEKGQQYKTLWEQEKKKREEAEVEAKKTLGWAMNTHRFGEVKAKALQAGLRKEAVNDLELIDMEDVPVETTSSGRFIANGVNEKVERIKADKPHWFTQPSPPNINPGGSGAPPTGGAATGKTTISDLQLAERNMRMGKVSKSDYEATYRKYCKDNPRQGSVAQAEPTT